MSLTLAELSKRSLCDGHSKAFGERVVRVGSRAHLLATSAKYGVVIAVDQELRALLWTPVDVFLKVKVTY